jgi:hypothetical protein
LAVFAQNQALRKNKRERTYQRVGALVWAEVFARHTVTQLLISLGRSHYEWVSAVFLQATLKRGVAGDATHRLYATPSLLLLAPNPTSTVFPLRLNNDLL